MNEPGPEKDAQARDTKASTDQPTTATNEFERMAQAITDATDVMSDEDYAQYLRERHADKSQNYIHQEVPPEFREKLWPEHYRNVMDRFMQLVDLKHPWYLWGDVGVGKTHYAYALVIHNLVSIAKAIVFEDASARKPLMKIYNFPEDVNILHLSEWSNKRAVLNRYCRSGPTIIDDIGGESISDQSLAMLYTVLEHRKKYQLYTGFTSNWKIDDLPYDKRLRSRIVRIVKKNNRRMAGEDWSLK